MRDLLPSQVIEAELLTYRFVRWVRIANTTPKDSMYGHTCHAIGSQMIVVGGHFANWGKKDLDTCHDHLISLYDMNTKEVILEKKLIETKSNI